MSDDNFLSKTCTALAHPSYTFRKKTAFLVLFSQILITFTGSIVRVTSSGLGCSTWPKCHPDSFVFTKDNHTSLYHQLIEFSNRQLAIWFVTVVSILIIWVVHRSHSSRQIQVLAWLIGIGTISQGLLGGITVLWQLLWWIVALHLLLSLAMVWCAAVLYTYICGENITNSYDASTNLPTAISDARYISQLHRASIYAAIAATLTAVAGTLVTGAGPLAGDISAEHTVKRLECNIVTLITVHITAVIILACVIGYIEVLLVKDFNFDTAQGTFFDTTFIKLPLLITIQACVGIMQTYLKLPAILVMLHVVIASLIIAALAQLYAKIQLARRISAEKSMLSAQETLA